MPQNRGITTSLSPEPPDRGGPDAVLPKMSMATRALIESYLRDVKAFERAALQIEMDAAARQNAAKPINPAVTTQAYSYRQLAQGEMATLVLMLQHLLPRASLEQRYTYVQQNVALSVDDLDRVWNALLGR